MARVVSNSSRVISFIETFASHCYVVSQSGASSVVQSFNISSISVLTYTSPRDRVMSVEHIDVFKYVALHIHMWHRLQPSLVDPE